MHLIEGLFWGFASILFIGPVVFELINASVIKSKYGIAVALGIILGDIIYVFAVYNSLKFIIGNEMFNDIVSYAGFAILLAIGIIYFFKKAPQLDNDKLLSKGDYPKYFLRGFSINFFNPFVLTVWIMVVKYAKTTHTNQSISFLIAALLGIFLIDLFKIYLSKKLMRLLKSDKILIFYKVSGLVMIGFSLRILYYIITR